MQSRDESAKAVGRFRNETPDAAAEPRLDRETMTNGRDAIPKALQCLAVAQRVAQNDDMPQNLRAILSVQIGTAIGILNGARDAA